MLEAMENIEVTDMVANDDVTESVAEAIAENSDKFEFDIGSGLIGAGIVVVAHLAYKYVPIAWQKLTSKFGKKNEECEDDEDDVFDEDDEDETDDTESVDAEEVGVDTEGDNEVKKANRRERRKKKNKR